MSREPQRSAEQNSCADGVLPASVARSVDSSPFSVTRAIPCASLLTAAAPPLTVAPAAGVVLPSGP